MTEDLSPGKDSIEEEKSTRETPAQQHPDETSADNLLSSEKQGEEPQPAAQEAETTAPVEEQLETVLSSDDVYIEDRLLEEEEPTETLPALKLVKETPTEVLSNLESIEETPADVLPTLEPVEETPIETLPSLEPIEEIPADVLPALEPGKEASADVLSDLEAAEETPAHVLPSLKPGEEIPADILPVLEPGEEAPAEALSDLELIEGTSAEMLSTLEPADETPTNDLSDLESVDEDSAEVLPALEAVEEVPAASEADLDVAAHGGRKSSGKLSETTIASMPSRTKKAPRKRRWLVAAIICVVLALLVPGVSLYPVFVSQPGLAAVHPTPTAVQPTPTPTTAQPTATPTTAQPTATPTTAQPTHSVPAHPTTPTPPPPPPPNPNNLSYYNGYVQLHPTNYVIFWGAGWNTDPAAQTTKQVVESYFANSPGSSYASVLNQYYMVNADGSRSYISGLGSYTSVVDPTDPPFTSTACGSQTVTDTDIQGEISRHLSANDHNASYFVYTLPGVIDYQPGMGCSTPPGCTSAGCPGHWGADHEWSTFGGAPVAYSLMPYPMFCRILPNDSRCTDQQLVMLTAHEQFEAATDPHPPRAGNDKPPFNNLGWFRTNPATPYLFGPNFGEIGDVCYGSFSWQIGGRFYLQPMWSNRYNGCSYSG